MVTRVLNLFITTTFLAQTAGANTLIAAGKTQAAAAAMQTVAVKRVEQAMREGMSPRIAIQYLSLAFPSKKDQAYLKLALKGQEAPDRAYTFRAFERIPNGYRLTNVGGHVVEFAYNAKTNRVMIGGHDVPKPSAGAEAYLAAVQKNLTLAKFAGFNVFTLFSPSTADAAFFVPVAMAIVVGLYALSPLLALRAKNNDRRAVAEGMANLAQLCDEERNSRPTAYEASETAKTVQLLTEQNLLDVDAVKSAQDCEKGGDTAEACANLIKFSRCASSYRKIEPVTITPAKATGTEGVAR